MVFIPKYRKKVIYGELRPHLGEVLRRLAQRRESEVEEGHLMVDHVHLILSIPPKYSVAQVVGYIKGKSAIHIARHFAGRPRNYVGQHPLKEKALRQTRYGSRWTCQYHVVFIPKYRKKVIYGELRPHLGEVLRRLAQRRESEVEEGHLMVDHVHLILSIPPKYSVAQVVGYIKGKSAIHIARHFAGRPRNYVGQHFWARGYFVSTVGRDEQTIRAYIRDQEHEDRRQEQLRLDKRSHP